VGVERQLNHNQPLSRMQKYRMLELKMLLVLFTLCATYVSGQHCVNTCPPLNDLGQPKDALCVGDLTMDTDSSKEHKMSYIDNYDKQLSFSLSDFKGQGRVTVIGNYQFGCNAGRNEANHFARLATTMWEEHGERVTFIANAHGAPGDRWIQSMRNDGGVTGKMPLVARDTNYVIRDLYFTAPFGHPSYVILDGDLEVRHKYVGPCCGKQRWTDCSSDDTTVLKNDLVKYIGDILSESPDPVPTQSPIETLSPTQVEGPGSCETGKWSDWSVCSASCGAEDSGIQFKWRIVKDTRIDTDGVDPCPKPVATQSCSPLQTICGSVCVPETGEMYEVKTVADDFNSPRDIKFHPTPGYHLGEYSEGRKFSKKNKGDGEAWVLNGSNHSVSIVSAVRSKKMTTLSRRDRGYYHYMINSTALSFNLVGNSGRNPDRDSFNYFAVCNDNLNTYLDTKEANYFMGPTLYNSFPGNNNTVNRLGQSCEPHEPCYFLHSDMLHEAPGCTGIAHDPEITTAYGNVYWAFDTTGNRMNGELVRFDFQQPHGPGSMEHSIAATRRYNQVKLTRGPAGVHTGMVVHPTRREIYIANSGEGTVIAVSVDTGEYARVAREEYPIYSSRLPNFDYSIWECAEQRVFASGLSTPSGIALSKDGERLFVAEHGTGNIIVYEIESSTVLDIITTEFNSIGGMDISPNTGNLFFVDDESNTLNAVVKKNACESKYTTRITDEFSSALEEVNEKFEEEIGSDSLSLYRDYLCVVNTTYPNITYFDQVHDSTGYASNDTDVQGPDMDESAALLANRTDCGYDSELNFDALLLGGFYCHTCLPIDSGAMCESGGVCQNIQWEGYTCDNHFYVDSMSLSLRNSSNFEKEKLFIDLDVKYRFTITGSEDICLTLDRKGRKKISIPGHDTVCVKKGPLIFRPVDIFPKPKKVYLHSRHLKKSLQLKFCEDGELSFKNDEKKDCDWVNQLSEIKKKKICKKRQVKKSCPKACGKC